MKAAAVLPKFAINEIIKILPGLDANQGTSGNEGSSQYVCYSDPDATGKTPPRDHVGNSSRIFDGDHLDRRPQR
jgi:hypothetical protein